MQQQLPAAAAYWSIALDQCLRMGATQGRQGTHKAIDRVMEACPALTRAQCWQRMRWLREHAAIVHPKPNTWPAELIEQLREGYCRGGACKREAFCAVRSRYPNLPGHIITRFARRQGWLVNLPASVSRRRRWTATEQAHFAAMAEQQPVATIARVLGRSRKAIRWRLGAQGLSAKVEGIWSARRLTSTLHVGRTTLRRWIAEHLVRVRDAHITGSSLLVYRARNLHIDKCVTRGGTASNTIQPDQCYGWKEAAKLLGYRIEFVRQGVAHGTLKLADALVSDQALHRFCQHYALGRLDRGRIDPGVHRWLVREYGLPPEC